MATEVKAKPTARIAGRKPRVLHVVDTLNLGGAEVLLAGALPKLAAAGYEIVVRALTQPDTLGEPLRSAGIDTDVLWERGPARTRQLLLPAIRLRKFLEEEPVDLIHAHLFNANLVARSVALSMRGPRPRFVTTLHSSYYSNLSLSVQGWKARGTMVVDWASGMASNDAIVAVSRSSAADFVRHIGQMGPWGRIEVIPNGIDVEQHARVVEALGETETRAQLRRSLGWEPDQLAVLSVGRLISAKNYFAFVESIERAHATGLRIRGLVLGDGPDRRALVARAGDMVSFPGQASRERVLQALAACDVYVQPSRFDACSISVLEGMAAGKPVVATRVDGNPELVVDGETGLLVDQTDPGQMAQALCSIAANPEQSRIWGRRGQERCRSMFSLESWVARTDSLYKRVLAPR